MITVITTTIVKFHQIRINFSRFSFLFFFGWEQTPWQILAVCVTVLLLISGSLVYQEAGPTPGRQQVLDAPKKILSSVLNQIAHWFMENLWMSIPPKIWCKYYNSTDGSLPRNPMIPNLDTIAVHQIDLFEVRSTTWKVVDDDQWGQNTTSSDRTLEMCDIPLKSHNYISAQVSLRISGRLTPLKRTDFLDGYRFESC